MINKKIIGIGTVLVILLLILANVPSVAAHVPGTNPADPSLDPSEGSHTSATGIYSFRYGHSPNYGSYIRDFQWSSPGTGWDRYIGMLSVPIIRINGVNWTFSSPAVGRNITQVAPDHDVLSFNYMTISDVYGHTHTITIDFDIWDTPPSPISPASGTDLLINITITDTIVYNGGPPSGWTFDVPIRADFDIADLTNFVADQVYTYTSNPTPPPVNTWLAQGTETAWPITATRITDPLYNMEVMMDDVNVTGSWPTGPWGGIVPPSAINTSSATDTFYLLLFNLGEYMGPPASYNNGQGLGLGTGGADIVVWDDTSLYIPNTGGSTYGTINLLIWMR